MCRNRALGPVDEDVVLARALAGALSSSSLSLFFDNLLSDECQGLFDNLLSSEGSTL